ncbi:hypothetical protein [Priestia megaterium]|uniref:hypothetical protein n=1 Tax=Priestia megaterium TaxID=1404 RepID=UPI00372CE93F
MATKLTEEVLFTLNHKAFDKFCESAEFYIETKKVAEDYKKEKEALSNRLELFKKERQDLQEQHIKKVTEMEAFKDNPTEYVYSKIEADDIASKVTAIDFIISEMENDFLELKMKFFPLFQTAITEDRSEVYTAFETYNKAVEKVANEMLEAVKEAQTQARRDLPADVQASFNDVVHDSRLPEINWGKYRGGHWTRFFPEVATLKISK